MRAMVVRRFGGPEVLEPVEVPAPEPGPGQLRIRVAAAAVNPVDVATRAGWLTEAGVVPPREVLGLGWDVAGTVETPGGGFAAPRRRGWKGRRILAGRPIDEAEKNWRFARAESRK